MKVLYTALFVDDVDELKSRFPQVHPNEYYHHSTIEFSPESTDLVQVGRPCELIVTGRITNDLVDVLLVRGNGKSVNEFPHITLSTAANVKPYSCNEEIEKVFNNLQPKQVWTMLSHSIGEKPIKTTEGFFTNGREVASPLEQTVMVMDQILLHPAFSYPV